MNFDFSDDEKLIADQVERFLAANCEPVVVRRVLEGEEHYDAGVWQGLADMGLTGATIPEDLGGVGAGYLSTCLVAEKLGASLAPVPFSSSVYLASEALMGFASEAQQQAWLPKLATGETIGTLALVGTREEVRPDNLGVRLEGGKLFGEKLIVPDADVADVMVVLVESADGLRLVLVEKDATVRTETLDTVDPSRNLARVTFDGTAAELLGDARDAWADVGTVLNRAAVMLAFEQIGGAQKALDMAVAYAKERFAFGRPIGSFQALKHMMADMYVALRLAESNCYYAAWALSTNDAELPLAAATARVSATQAYQLCARDNIQVHGGMGFTWEFDCHLHYRRSNYLTLVLGGLSDWEDRLVSSLPTAA